MRMPEENAAAELEDLYSGDVEAPDLLVGCLTELHRPTGFGFGQTGSQVFILNASRRLQTDRFYTTHYTKWSTLRFGAAEASVIDATSRQGSLHHKPGYRVRGSL